MPNITFSSKSYIKMMFHAAKYPHLAVNGLLLGSKDADGSILEVVDAVPLFHQCLYVTPMAEIALIMVEAHANSTDQQIIGYYAAAENFYDNSIDKVPGGKIADKIAENYNSGLFTVIDNRGVSIKQNYPALKVWQQSTDSKWVKTKYSVEDTENTLEAVSLLLERGAMKALSDFDNYLDNTENDFYNKDFNYDLNQILSMN